MDDVRTLSLFAGPGGFCEAARMLRIDLGILGVELDRHAAATARAAGHKRMVADVTTLSPRDFPNATGLICTPPCPPFSASGKRLGLGEDYQEVLDAITCLGSDDCDDECWKHGGYADPRSHLVVQTARWALQLPALEWLACEQVPGVEYIWEDIAAELFAAGWEWVDVLTLDATDYGAGARRTRTFLLARKYAPAQGNPYARKDAEPVRARDVLGWPAGEQMRTRNNRRPTGGNLFSTDGPSWCLTGKARSWERDSDGARITAAQAGALQGFPFDYPWQGSRTAQFQQAGDVVSPLVGAAVLGTVHGIDWRPAVAARSTELANGPAHIEPLTIEVAGQYAMF